MTSDEKKLLYYFSLLGDEQREMVMDFLEFLGSKYPQEPSFEPQVEIPEEEKSKIVEPDLTQRPESESVIAAIKRLSNSYPMLNKEKLFDKTSLLMTSHILQGRDAVEVIDEMEGVFKGFYDEYLKEKEGL